MMCILIGVLGSVAGAAAKDGVVSPQVFEDGRVAFRLLAPRAAEVILRGTFLGAPEPEEGAPMIKQPSGVWEKTVGPLAPDIYSYSFVIDGAEVCDPCNPNVKVYRPLRSLVQVPGDTLLPHEVWNVPHGVLHRHWYHSESLGEDRAYVVYTPPGYGQTVKRPLPVLLLLHGYGDNESAWTDVGKANLIADNLLAQEHIKPMIIVMPYGEAYPRGLEWPEWSRRNAERLATDIFNDVLPDVRRQYAVDSAPDKLAVAGLSMGGGQAIAIGMTRFAEVKWVGAFSSSIPKGDLNEQFADFVRSTKEGQPLRLFWCACGEKDSLVESNDAFAQWLGARKIEHEYTVTPGFHEWETFRRHLEAFLPLIFK